MSPSPATAQRIYSIAIKSGQPLVNMDRGWIPPPSGVVPDFRHQPENDRRLLACVIVFFLLSTVCVSLRLYARVFITRSLGWDDCKTSIELFIVTWLTSHRCMQYCICTPLNTYRVRRRTCTHTDPMGLGYYRRFWGLRFSQSVAPYVHWTECRRSSTKVS